jgi:N4-gp56 family major capsid protein
MARTLIGVNDPKALKKQSAILSVMVNKEAFFARGFITNGADSMGFIQRIDDLKKESGDEVSCDLLMPSKQDPIIGADMLEGNEEQLIFYTDKVKIDQVRGGQNVGDTMTRKRTLYDVRKKALRIHKDWWKRVYDEAMFIYASGTLGNVTGFVWRPNNKFFNVNPLTAPDTSHQFYGGAATSLATLTAGDVATVAGLERLTARAEVMGGDATSEISMLPGKIGDEDAYCLVLHPFAALNMRTSVATGSWMDIQKAAVTHEGRDNPIFKGGSSLGVVNGVILKKHRNVITMNGGAGGAVNCARNLFMGRQALFLVSGNAGDDLGFSVTEEVKDHGDKVAIGSKCIFGVKKATYLTDIGARDFGVIAYDTSCIAA